MKKGIYPPDAIGYVDSMLVNLAQLTSDRKITWRYDDSDISFLVDVSGIEIKLDFLPDGYELYVDGVEIDLRVERTTEKNFENLRKAIGVQVEKIDQEEIDKTMEGIKTVANFKP